MDANLYTQIMKDELQQILEYYGKTPDDIIFQQDNDRFETKCLKSRYSKKEYTNTDSESDVDDSDTDYDTDNESDNGFETYTPKCKSKQKSSKDDQGKTGTTSKKISKQDTMDELVDKMNKLSIHEPAYPKAYFQAISINPLVEKVYPMPVTKGEAKEVSLLTFPLPYDAPKITSPIPFTIYPCRAFTNNPSPFLHNYYKFYNDHNSSLLPLSQPPCDEPSTPSSTSPPPPPLFKPGVKTALDLARMKKQEKNLRKLEEPQDIFHKASRINGDYGAWNKIDPSFDPPKDKICIVTQNNNVHELEFVPQQPGWHPFSTYDYSKQTSFLNMTHTTPLPSLSSSPDMSEDELADNEEDDQDDSSYGSDYNNYPTSHPKFITTAPSVVRTIKPTITMKIPASIPANHTHIPSNGLT
ncbi:hypothetical protein V8E55_011279 [Tylopilus felleus]